MDEEYIGVIKLFAGNFAPKGYQFCAGQLLPIQGYQALFSILGITYGGDGRTTFALPDLRGKVPVCQGQSPGTNFYRLGDRGGSEQTTLNVSNMPPHNHGVRLSVSASNANQSVPAANSTIAAPGTSSGRDFTGTLGFNSEEPNTVLNAESVKTDNMGGGAPINNIQPYLALNYIICIYGLFPPRE